MRTLSADLSLALILATIALVLHTALQRSLVSYAPLPVLLSLLWTWNLTRPTYYVIGLAVVAELFSTLPLGIVAGVVLLPLLVRRFTGLHRVDLSFTYLAIVAATVGLQTAALVAYDAGRVVLTGAGPLGLINAMPWFPASISISFTTAIAFLISIIRSNQPGFTQSEARIFRVRPYAR